MDSSRPLRLVPPPAAAILNADAADAPAAAHDNRAAVRGIGERLKAQRQADEDAVGEWARFVTGEQKPDATTPTLAALEAWLPECPDEAALEANARLEPLTGQPGRWLLYPAGLRADYRLDDATVTVRPANVLAAWEAGTEEGGQLAHPLTPLIAAWLDRPPQVEPSRHPRPIVPDLGRQTAIEIVGETPERERGRLFGFVPEGAETGQLPLFGARPGGIVSQVPLLGIADATTGGAVTAQGRGAPLELAVPVTSMVSLRPEDRRLPVVRIALTVRELRDALWPNGWERRHDWPRLQDVLERLSGQFVPWGNGGKWFPLALRGLPGPDAGLDELVVLDLAMPPGTDQGTPIDRMRLSELRVRSGGAYRAYIATASLAWRPGTTRVRAGRRFLWATDPERYPILTRQDRREIIYGTEQVKPRTTAEIDGPFETLAGAGDIVILDRDAYDPESHEPGWRIVPQAADSDKLRERAAEHANR